MPALSDLSANELTIVEAIGSGLLGAVLASLGFLAKRWLTGAKTQEKATLYGALADLLAKLREHGFSLDHVRELESYFAGKIKTVGAHSELAGLEALRAEPPGEPDQLEGGREPDQYWTQYAMNVRAGAAFETADARLREALVELGTLISEDEERALEKVQRAWRLYRARQVRYAASLYRGVRFSLSSHRQKHRKSRNGGLPTSRR